MSLHQQHSHLITTATLAASAVAALGVISLTALQSDACSRLVLSPGQLQSKRCQEYQYKWSQALEKTELQLQYCWAGGVHKFDADMEQLVTEIWTLEDEINEFIQDVLLPCAKEICVGRIGVMHAGQKEYYIWLYHTSCHVSRIYQVPLGLFGRLLAAQQERHVTRTTFCFVSDASSGAAVDCLVDLVDAAAKACSVVTVRDPVWMVVLARLVEQRVLLAGSETLQTLVFSLCRLEALKVQEQEDTVLITVPQAIVPVMLPILQQVFPDDRHVFSYTGCIPAVQTALAQVAKAPRAVVPDHMRQAVRFTNPVAICTPLSQTSSSSALSKSTNVMEPFTRALQALPVRMAQVTETWMAAVDAFFQLKEDEKDNGYLPYVFRLDYIVNNNTGKLPEATSDCYWSAMSLLQFVTGSKSRQVSSQTTDAVLSWLRDVTVAPAAQAAGLSAAATPAISASHKKSIENCVFQHKLILIANKTLKDTVQPAQHWTLKAAAKRGCSCCAPEEEDDNDNDENDQTDGNDEGGILNMMASPATTTTRTSNVSSSGRSSNNKYVDGKTTFAFDPSKFK